MRSVQYTSSITHRTSFHYLGIVGNKQFNQFLTLTLQYQRIISFARHVPEQNPVIFHPEGVGKIFLRNIGKFTPVDTSSHPRSSISLGKKKCRERLRKKERKKERKEAAGRLRRILIGL
jgi:hypothetical protein